MKEVIGAFVLLAGIYVALFVGTGEIPEAPAESCSCAGKMECVTRVAEVTEHSRAYCALWIEEDQQRDSCCLVVGMQK
jgi:hypothetical protein